MRGQSKISCPLNIDGFSRGGARRAALLALHPDRNNDDYRKVTFLAEATRPADLIVVDHVLGEILSRRAIGRMPSPLALARITLARNPNPGALVGARNYITLARHPVHRIGEAKSPANR